MMSNLGLSKPMSNNNGMTEKEEDDHDDDTHCCHRRQSNSHHHHQEETAIVPYYFHQAFPLYRLLLLPYFMETAVLWKQPPPPPRQETNDLLRDLLPTILSYTDAQTLSQCAQVCHQWDTIAKEESHWENLCRKTFQVSSSQLRPKPHPKDLYIMIHQQWIQLYQSATSRDPLRGTNLTALPPAISITLMQ